MRSPSLRASRWRAAVLLLLITALTGCGDGPPVVRPVRIGERIFQMELAVTQRQRVRGLSNRDSLTPGTGMLFVLPKAEVVSFVMRDCRFAIDIAFLDPQGRVVALHEMKLEPPGTPENKLKAYSSQEPAKFAMEFPEGTIRELKLEIGQVIELPLNELAQEPR